MQDVRTAAPMNLETLQQWTATIGQAQQMMLEFWANQSREEASQGSVEQLLSGWSSFGRQWSDEGQKLAERQARLMSQSLDLWTRFLAPADEESTPSAADRDRRFKGEAWRDYPFFDLIRQSYLLAADHLLGSVDDIEGLDPAQRERLRFTTRAMVEALSPSNFAFTNPEVIQRTLETGGQNLVTGLQYMLSDLSQGQLTQTRMDAFEVGRNIAATPGKVVFENAMFQLIQYTPTTARVHEKPLLIFPPWINRFYILDLSPEKSFIKWAVDQGITVFVVSWKSADESLKDVTADDYVLNGQITAIDTVRDLLGVKSVNTIGYCVAGTTLAMTLAYLGAKKQSAKVQSATFFTAQVDFEEAGDLKLFVDDEQLALVSSLSEGKGYLDGRFMAAAFNLLRGQDLIWNYVVNNYLLGKEYTPFDLLYWNSDFTNLPAKWHLGYLTDLYRDNKLAKGEVSIAGTPIDLTRVKTPAYVQAGREDHIAPPGSVWKMTDYFKGPLKFVLAGSGHIAGVVNPPASGKYQYWTNEKPAASLDAFLEGATETKGSWWPDWLEWMQPHLGKLVPAEGARLPGGNPAFPAIEDAPGRYVKTR